jgi:hypothetical protein
MAANQTAQDRPDAERPAQPSEGGFDAAGFRGLVTEFEHKEEEHRREVAKEANDERRQRVDELVKEHVSDQSWQSILRDARQAAEAGQKEWLMLRFPSELASDGGRAVNVMEGDWPATLRGEAEEIYRRWEEGLKPRGFRLAARVLDFPGGMPGDIGLFLIWGGDEAGA